MQYKWKALGVVNIGSLMGSIDATVLIIAFPQVARDLQATLVEMVWVLMIYTVMGTALVLSLGRVADMKGRRRLYAAGFSVFILGSALCGFAPSGLALVGFRALQGVGGAMLLANSFAILSDAFPAAERGRAFGINTIVWGSGSILGIFLGGLILTVTTWRWIFWINLPIGVAATVAALLVLRESVTPNPRDTFDFAAAGLFTGGLVSALFGATEGILTGWSDPRAVVPLLLAIPLLVGFVVWEMRVSRDPILPLWLFRRWIFSASLAAAVLQGLALFSTNFLLMAYFQGLRDVSVLTAADLLIPLFVALAVVGPLGGRLADRYGARVLSTVGLLVQAAALAFLTTLNAQTPLAAVAAAEGLLGVGGGLFFPANTSAIMSSSPPGRYGVASGIMMTLRNSSTSLSYAVALVVLTSRLPAGSGAAIFGGAFAPTRLAGYSGIFVNGMHAAFAVAMSAVLAAAIFSALRGREDRGAAERSPYRPAVRPPRREVVPTGEVDRSPAH
jgi:EmrB/QacA subfamily drug resistance transporter